MRIPPQALPLLFAHSSSGPPGILAARAAFMAADLRRSASLAQVALLPPPGNFLTEVARGVVRLQRMLCAAAAHSQIDDAGERSLALAISKKTELNSAMWGKGVCDIWEKWVSGWRNKMLAHVAHFHGVDTFHLLYELVSEFVSSLVICLIFICRICFPPLSLQSSW